MTRFSKHRLRICFFVVGFSLFTWCTWMNNYLAQTTGISSGKIIRYLIDSADSSDFTFKLSRCWTDAYYQLWKHEQLFPPQKTRGSIVYMVMTGDLFLRSRCDVIMCTFGVTLHPSRIIFVGETSSDSRLPIYNVVTSDTPRPINRDGSMQKLARGLAMLVQMIDRSNYKNEIQWIMVMDDDTFVSPPNLESLVSEYNSQSNNFHPLLNSVNQCLESPKVINSFHYVS